MLLSVHIIDRERQRRWCNLRVSGAFGVKVELKVGHWGLGLWVHGVEVVSWFCY